MNAVLYSLVTLATQWLRPRYNVRLRLLEAQIRMLRARIDTSCIVPTPQERAELLRLGAAMNHDIDEVMHVVVSATYRKWLRQLRSAKRFRSLGRPRTPMAPRLLVVRLNPRDVQRTSVTDAQIAGASLVRLLPKRSLGIDHHGIGDSLV